MSALALFFVTLAPAASALPEDAMGLPPLGDAVPSIQQGLSTLSRAAEQTTGQSAPLPESAPRVIAPPDADLGWGYERVIPVAAASIAGLGLLTAALYLGTRYVTQADVLKNDVRQRIMDFLKARTGANLKQITDELRLTTTNAIWHLRKLEDAGLVHSRRFNGYKLFYPAEGGVHARRMSLSIAALVNGNAQEVFEYVVAHPGAHQREIARALGVNHGTVRWHLKKLRRAELLDEARVGKTSTYHPTETGVAALKMVVAQQVVQPAPVVAVPVTPAQPVTLTPEVGFAPTVDIFGASPSRGVTHRP